jgi:peroxiredoxin
VHGSWCPKEQVRLRNLVDAQDELQREYGRIAVATVDEPYVNGAFRAGIGADFPFLSDEERRIADELDLLELTDELHRPLLPYTLVLD